MLPNYHVKNNIDLRRSMNIKPDFKQLSENLNTAVMVVDNQLCLLYMNSACEALLQVSLGHATGMPINDFYIENKQSLAKISQTLTTENNFTKRKVSWVLHNKKRITVDYTVTPLNSLNQILFEIHPLDRLLQIGREEATIASQNTTRNLVRGLAHEVKNPLGGIRGAAQLLDKELDKISDNPELKDYTQIIIAESDRLRNLVDRMLGPRHIVEFKATNIHLVLERVITLINAETKGSIALQRQYDPSIPDIMCDSELLIQAVLNVVRNAIQALIRDSNNPKPTLTVSTNIHRQFTIGRKFYPLVCCVVIADNGPGIPSDIIADIFYPMISGRADGSGLGLSISQQLINQHHGLIECASEPGDTRFSLYIPLRQTT